MHESGEHVVEHHPIGDPAAVTSPRMTPDEFGAIVDLQQRGELDDTRNIRPTSHINCRMF